MKLVLALTRLNPTLPGSFPFTGRGRLIILTALLAISWTAATALVQAQGPTMHPTFPLLDASGTNVLESRAPLSTLKTCGGCHDTAYIARHNFHADAGLSQFTAPGQVAGGRPWDTSPGYFGRWDPITYRYLTTTPTERLDLSLSDWIRQFGGRHVGGGPAELAASGVHRASPDSSQPVSPRINLETAEPDPWDWAESGGVELNCFLCHLPKPNNQARRQALAAGAFKWANTATLVGTGIVTQTNGEFNWLPQAFTPQGRLAQEFVTLQDPANDNCGLCHGQVHTNNDEPLILTDNNWRTATTGEIFSPQRVFKTGLNVQDKQNLSRALDVHAERVVDCVDCHNSVNNPVYFQGTKDGELAHLIFDARRISIEDYLYRPSHDLANGPSANRAMAPEFAGTPGRCQSCHDPGVVHEWLPYKEAHFAKLSCETCHVPKLYGLAYQQVDWTVVTEQGEKQAAYRGIEGDPFEVETLLTGYQPILLPAPQNEGSESLAPYNLISAWYWVYGDPARPVRLVDLQAAYLDEAGYRPDVLAVFDANGNGTLEAAEQRLDTAEKETLIRQNLTSLGLDRLQIRAEIQP
ncbi:MAG TPA: hypothetical protein PKE64_23650, partial [Anaerolineae bacterium]|nr:hypothetical protein [Anaerolineae bacterium]